MRLPNPRGMLLACLLLWLATLMMSAVTRASSGRLRIPSDYQAWSRVATCESGGWRVLGRAYPDPLGITAKNWKHFGGLPLPVGPVALRQRIAVIRIADRFRRSYGIPIPDQEGCGAW